MIKLLVIENNYDLLNQLKQYFEHNKNILVKYTTEDGIEGINLITENVKNYDIIVMSLILKSKDGISILREMKERNIKKPVIICSCCNSETMINEATSFDVCGYILKPYENKDLENKIKDVIRNKKHKKSIYESTIELLHALGIPSKYKGYTYLKEAIISCYYKGEFMANDIYIELAKKHNVSRTCVERSICRAIDIGFSRNNVDYVESVFGTSVNFERGSPTNLEFIATIVERLNMMK